MKQKHGALIYKAGRVLAVGINTTRNQHPTMEISHSDYTYHAEINAIRAVGNPGDLKGATVYIARTNRSGTLAYSAPCNECLKAINSAGIKRIVYS
jgi:deoxycytidylate deaminase